MIIGYFLSFNFSRVVPPTSKNNEPRNLIVTPPDPIQSRDSPSPLDTRVRGGLTRERSVGSSNAESMQELEFDEQRRRSEEKAFFAGNLTANLLYVGV